MEIYYTVTLDSKTLPYIFNTVEDVRSYIEELIKEKKSELYNRGYSKIFVNFTDVNKKYLNDGTERIYYIDVLSNCLFGMYLTKYKIIEKKYSK